MSRSLLVPVAVLIAVGCRSERTTQAKAEAPAAVASPAPNAPAWKSYGAKVTPGQTTTLASMLAEPERFQNKSVTVEGTVRRACTRKGCWMEIGESADPGTPGCRVTFKDYGFFVPTDSAGARARVQGTVTVEVVAANYVKHLEEEGARFSSKAADGTAREVRFVADGVELQK